MQGATCRTPAQLDMGTIMRTYLALPVSIAFIGLLAGCATPEQQAAHAQQEMERTMAIYGPACERLGYQANTDQWRNCVMQLSYKDDVQRYSAYVAPFWSY
jgi:hypothetical protein